MIGAMIRPLRRLITTTNSAIATSMTRIACPGVRPPGRPKKTASPLPNANTVTSDAAATTPHATTTIAFRTVPFVMRRRTPLTRSGKATRKTISSLIAQCAAGRR